jgi:hypothetical protein
MNCILTFLLNIQSTCLKNAIQQKFNYVSRCVKVRFDVFDTNFTSTGRSLLIKKISSAFLVFKSAWPQLGDGGCSGLWVCLPLN